MRSIMCSRVCWTAWMPSMDSISGLAWEAPYLNVQPGVAHGKRGNFTITVEGSSTHGSTPHLGTEPLWQRFHHYEYPDHRFPEQ